MNENTMVQLKKSTVERLKKLHQHADDTYDIVINRLIDYTDSSMKTKNQGSGAVQ